MADITSKAAIVPVTPKAAEASSNAAGNNNGGTPSDNNNHHQTTSSSVGTNTEHHHHHHHHLHHHQAPAPPPPTAAAPTTASSAFGSGGFNSLPSSIHHGLSERLHGLTEKLHALGGGGGGSNAGTEAGESAPRSRTSSLGTRERFGVHLESGGGGGLFPLATPRVVKSSQGSPTKTHSSSRNSSKKSNQSQLVTNGKLDGE